jgi:sugar transferase EpsL
VNTVRRTIDVVVAVTALVVLSPVLLFTAVAIRVTMGSPVLFRQRRSGLGGGEFEIVKFRTMRPALDGQRGPADDRARLTRLGSLLRATSIDELPSLINVLRGDVGLVGPRPLPVSYLARYSAEQARRLEVRPGLTGWAQIHGRNTVDWPQRLALDVWYVDHRSLWLDARIIAKTIPLVLKQVGVEQRDGTTMTEFRGPQPGFGEPPSGST